MAEKIYIVRSDHKIRLVQAVNKIAALRHVAQSDYSVNSASPGELVEAVKKGVEVEIAGLTPPIE